MKGGARSYVHAVVVGCFGYVLGVLEMASGRT